MSISPPNCSVHDDMLKEREDNLELIDSMITQSQLMYYAQPPPDLAALPPDTTITTKSGYLNVQKWVVQCSLHYTHG